MKAETEALLYQCRTALLQRNGEELDTLLKGWFECMIGEEHIEEELDDLCILLNYRVRSAGAAIAYGTYTAWWEVEGYPTFDRRVILSLAREELEGWRAEHQARVHARRKAGAQAAAANRKANTAF